MERDTLYKEKMILNCLSHLPRKILSMEDHANITEFVLHELCNENCYNLNKGAYFIDKPDFNCCKGVVGFSNSEAYATDGIWQEPDLFTEHMQKSAFNQKVRQWNHCSLTKDATSDQQWADIIATDLNLSQPHFCSWVMKNNNHGIFVYEKNDQEDGIDTDQIITGLCLLGFCPIF